MTRSTKIKVVIAFASRLLLVPPGVSRLLVLDKQRQSATPGHYTVQVTNLTIITMHTLVIATTIPCAKPFFSVFSSGILSRRRRPSRRMTLPSTRKAQSGNSSLHNHHDRARSLLQLQLRPSVGVNTSRIEHVPPIPSEQATPRRPSAAATDSSNSIRYTHDFQVSYMDISLKDVGGLLNQTTPRAPPATTTPTTPGTPPLLATPDSMAGTSYFAQTVRAQKSRSLTGLSSRRPSKPSGRSSQRSQGGSSPTLNPVEEASVSDSGIDRRLSR